MKISRVIYVEPRAKQRPVTISKGGKIWTFTPKKTVHTEALIREALMGIGSFGDGIPLRLEATFFRQRPKSLPKRVQLPVNKPDLSNLLKTLEDALEKFVYRSDSQIVDLHARKRFGSPPRIELTISSEDIDE